LVLQPDSVDESTLIDTHNQGSANAAETVEASLDKDEQSSAEALELENSQLMEAVRNSKADAPNELRSAGVVLLRLDRRARSEEVAKALLQAPCLESCRTAVEDAGCQLQPEWANGAWLLVPVTEEMFREAKLDTCAKHILALVDDEAAVQHALQNVPSKKRPQLRTINRAETPVSAEASNHDCVAGDSTEMVCSHACADSFMVEAASDTEAGVHIELVVEKTFWTFRTCCDAHSSISAPARLGGES